MKAKRKQQLCLSSSTTQIMTISHIKSFRWHPQVCKGQTFFMIKEYFKNSEVTVFVQEGAHLTVLNQESFQSVRIFYY